MSRTRSSNLGYYEKLPRKRMASGVLLFNDKGELLIVKPKYKDRWSVPGGVIEKNESPQKACLREAKEEIGLGLKRIKLLCVDYMSPHKSAYPTKDENIQFIFYGGILKQSKIKKIKIPSYEIAEYRFLKIQKALPLLNPNLHRRLRPSLKALKSKTVVYLENGKVA